MGRTKTITVDEDLYSWLLQQAAEQQLRTGQHVSIPTWLRQLREQHIKMLHDERKEKMNYEANE